MGEKNTENLVLALLFASDEPLSPRRISSILDEVPFSEIQASIETLKEKLNKEDSSIILENVAGGFQLSTNPAYSDYVARLYSGRRKQRLSKAGMEVLAIIAYKQPITRVEIETIRGVSCGGVINTLMERSLVKIVGKAKVLGAPFLYGSTPEFLEYLGLNSLKDLPSMEELEALLEKEEFSDYGDEAEAALPTSRSDEDDPFDKVHADEQDQ